MVRVRVPTLLIGLITLEWAAAEVLWCYKCNTDLSKGHRGECNDPFSHGPLVDLVSCPQNESHHCLKSIIFYRNILVTVRACIPSRKIEGYCRHDDFPDSHIECYFCDTYGCNHQGKPEAFSAEFLILLAISLIFMSKELS